MIHPSPKPKTQPSPPQAAVWAVNERMTQLVLQHLPPAIWRTKPPGNTRTIAAIVTHMHNIRIKWVRLSAPHLKLPSQLNRAHVTPQQAQAALAQSAASCAEMLSAAQTVSGSEIQSFHRDGWASPWPLVGSGNLAMLCYMLTHEAHHRGQIAMLSHQFGHPLPTKITSDLWDWQKLWRQENGISIGDTVSKIDFP
jgi:uncharacterized damage-inducible protein DinB